MLNKIITAPRAKSSPSKEWSHQNQQRWKKWRWPVITATVISLPYYRKWVYVGGEGAAIIIYFLMELHIPRIQIWHRGAYKNTELKKNYCALNCKIQWTLGLSMHWVPCTVSYLLTSLFFHYNNTLHMTSTEIQDAYLPQKILKYLQQNSPITPLLQYYKSSFFECWRSDFSTTRPNLMFREKLVCKKFLSLNADSYLRPVLNSITSCSRLLSTICYAGSAKISNV